MTPAQRWRIAEQMLADHTHQCRHCVATIGDPDRPGDLCTTGRRLWRAWSACWRGHVITLGGAA